MRPRKDAARADAGRLSAYHGRGWRSRAARFDEELGGRNAPWSDLRVDSEYGELKAVLLYCPGSELRSIRHPNAAQHLERIEPDRVSAEIRRLAAVYRKLGVAVHFIDRKAFPRLAPRFNLMFVRDLFFNTRAGSVLARMASRVRAGEERYAAQALSGLSIPIARTIGGRGLFEGADALWLDGKTVLCGIGGRTNAEGFRQLSDQLKLQDVRCLPVPLPRDVQHLLGILQLVDQGLALVRVRRAPAALLATLRRRRIEVVAVPETDEVTRGQAMNVVTVRPGAIVMPAGCEQLRKLCLRSGLEIAAEVAVPELTKGAGGLACATGILARRLVGP